MKKEIHPKDYRLVAFKDMSNNDVFLIRINSVLNVDSPMTPIEYELKYPSPNPFNPSVTIEYEISQLAYISGNIFNLKGQLIETVFSEYKSIGSYNLIWNASLYPSGINLFLLDYNSEILIKKIILLK